jgi:hypothetical protein
LDRSPTYWETFQNRNRQFRVDIVCNNPQEVIGCGFPRGDRSRPETLPMRLFRSRQNQAWYAAVYRSGKKVEQPVSVTVTPGLMNQWQIAVEVAGRRFLHRVPKLDKARKKQ